MSQRPGSPGDPDRGSRSAVPASSAGVRADTSPGAAVCARGLTKRFGEFTAVDAVLLGRIPHGDGSYRADRLLVGRALPACAVLVSFAFGAVGMVGTCYMRSWQDFDLVSLAIVPLFLFSGVFYPLSLYPAWLRIVVTITPLYQGVALLRGLDTGVLDPVLLVHACYLGCLGAIGLAGASRRLGRLLLP